MSLTTNLAQSANASSGDGATRDRHAPAASPARHLTRDLAGLTVVKVLVLTVIYLLFFSGASHRLPLDAAARIAGVPRSSETR
jgi:hypothetical protein